MIQISCPSCQRKLKLADNLQGKQIRCPACQNVFRVQAPDAEVAELAPQPVPPRPAARPPAPPRQPAVEEQLEMLEEAPARPAARPGPRRQAPAEVDYEELAEAEPDLRQGRRTAKRGALWLQLGFLFALIPYVIFAVMFFGLSAGWPGPGGRGAASSDAQQYGTALVLGMSVLYFIPVVFVAVAATMLANLKVRGLVITGCVFSFIVALQLLVYTIIWVGAFVQTSRYGTGMMILIPLLIAFTSFVGFVLNIVGGILGLITLRKPPVRAAYR